MARAGPFHDKQSPPLKSFSAEAVPLKADSLQIGVKKVVGQRGCLRVDFVAEDAGLVDAELRLGAVSELGASGKEGVVAYGLKNGKLRAGNFSSEELGAGLDGDDGINRAGNDLGGDGDFCERVRRKRRADCGGHDEDGEDARIAMGFGAFAESGLERGIGLGESGGFGAQAGVFERIVAHAVGLGRIAKILKTRKLRYTACDFEHRETSQREAGCADALGVDTGAESGVSEQLVKHGGQVAGALAPKNGSRDCVVFERIVARMIYGSDDIAMRSERGAEPGHHGRGAADAVGQKNQREFLRCCDERGVWCGFSSFGKRCVFMADPLHLLDGGGIGGIPNVGNEGVRFCAAPVVRLGRGEMAIHYADLVENSLGRAGFGGGKK